MSYTRPTGTAVNFLYDGYAVPPPTDVRLLFSSAAYTPPAANAANLSFGKRWYTWPAGTAVDFYFEDDGRVDAVATSAGAATTSAVSSSRATAVATSAGTASASVYMLVIASAAGVATTAAVGKSIARGAAVAAGAATPAVRGGSLVPAVGTSAGSSVGAGLPKQKKPPKAPVVNLTWIGVPDNVELDRNLDEPAPIDTDYVYSTPNGSAATLNMAFEAGAAPALKYDRHTIRLRMAQVNAGSLDGTGNTVQITVRLRNGPTGSVVVSQTFPLTGEWLDYTIILSNAQVDTIANYDALHIEFLALSNSGASANRRAAAVSWVQLEYGSVPVPSTVDAVGTAAGAATAAATGVRITAGLTVASSAGSSTTAAVGRRLAAAVATSAGSADTDAEGVLAFDADALSEGDSTADAYSSMTADAVATSAGAATTTIIGRERMAIGGTSMYTMTVPQARSTVMVPMDCARLAYVPREGCDFVYFLAQAAGTAAGVASTQGVAA